MIIKAKVPFVLASLATLAMTATSCSKSSGGGGEAIKNAIQQLPQGAAPVAPPADQATAPAADEVVPPAEEVPTAEVPPAVDPVVDPLEEVVSVSGVFKVAEDRDGGGLGLWLDAGGTERVIVATTTDGVKFKGAIDDTTGAYKVDVPAGVEFAIVVELRGADGTYAFEVAVTVPGADGKPESSIFGADGVISMNVVYNPKNKLASGKIDVEKSTSLKPSKLAAIKEKKKLEPTVFAKPFTGEWKAGIKGQEGESAAYVYGVPVGNVYFAQALDKVRLFESKKIAEACGLAAGGEPVFSMKGVPISFKNIDDFNAGLGGVYGVLSADVKAEIDALVERDTTWQKQSCAYNPYTPQDCKVVSAPADVTGSYDEWYQDEAGNWLSKLVTYSYPGYYALEEFDALADATAAGSRDQVCQTWLEWNGDGEAMAEKERNRDWTLPWCSNSATALDHSTGLGNMKVFVDAAGKNLNLLCRVTQTYHYKPVDSTQSNPDGEQSIPSSYQYLIQDTAQGATEAEALAVYRRPECDVTVGGPFNGRLAAEAQRTRELIGELVQSASWSKGQDICARFKAPTDFAAKGGFGQCAKLFANMGQGYGQSEPSDGGASPVPEVPKDGFALNEPTPATMSVEASEPVMWEAPPELCYQAQNVFYSLGMKAQEGSQKLVKDELQAGNQLWVGLEQAPVLCPLYFAANQGNWYETADQFQGCATEFAAASFDVQVEAILAMNKQWASALERLSCLAGPSVAASVSDLLANQCLPSYYMHWECDGANGCSQSLACSGSPEPRSACYDASGSFKSTVIGQIGGEFTLKPRFNGAFELTRVDVNSYQTRLYASEQEPNGGQESCVDTMTSSLRGRFRDATQNSFAGDFAMNYASSCTGVEVGKVNEALASGGQDSSAPRPPMAAPAPAPSTQPSGMGLAEGATSTSAPSESPRPAPEDRSAGERGEGAHFLPLVFERL